MNNVFKLIEDNGLTLHGDIEHFAELVRADERKQVALDKKAENARELGLDYEPVSKDNSNYRYDPPVAEPVAWKWHQAPVKTSWGHDMVVADLAIDKDNTVSVYCERDQKAKVEAMFTPPAQPAPVQEPVGPEPFGYFQYDIRLDAWVQNRINNKGVAFYTKEKP
jgi:hypothetical protein